MKRILKDGNLEEKTINEVIDLIKKLQKEGFLVRGKAYLSNSYPKSIFKVEYSNDCYKWSEVNLYTEFTKAGLHAVKEHLNGYNEVYQRYTGEDSE